jgi:hypothetical protein
MIGTRRKMLRSEKGMPEECDNRLGSKRNEIMKMLTYF